MTTGNDMKTVARRVSFIAALLLIPAVFAMNETSATDPQGRQGHLSGLTARIALPDGTVRTARIQGVGCSASLCSRVAIKGQADDDSLVSFWLDGIAVIRDTTEKDVSVVMRNGAVRRMSLVTGFRVLYLENRFGNPEKVDLAKINSIEFLPRQSQTRSNENW
jgi:hypothetical protein